MQGKVWEDLTRGGVTVTSLTGWGRLINCDQVACMACQRKARDTRGSRGLTALQQHSRSGGVVQGTGHPLGTGDPSRVIEGR